MERRKFLLNASLAGIACTSLGTVSCTPAANQNAVLPGSTELPDNTLNELSIARLQELLQSGAHTSQSITEVYLKRIQVLDKQGPHLNSVIELNPDALSMAEALDWERKNGKIRGALHGIPVLIKDNIDTGDKMMTTAGSLAMVGNKATQDAFIIKQLRQAGAVILGKTNLSEWANFRSTHSASGWSSRGGQTRNPYVLDRSPCGSSSGSAVAVAANLCAVAIGTETDGSVVAPSSSCGIVGLKPTVGLLSRSAIIPISSTQDTAGPMARTVRDAAILLGALTGRDEEDEATWESEGKSRKEYTSLLDTEALKGKRIGIEKSYLNGQEDVVKLYRQAIEILKKQGAEIIELEILKSLSAALAAEGTVMQYEFKEGLGKYLSKAKASMHSLADVISFNREHADKVMPFFKQEELEQSQTRGGLEEKTYTDALEQTRKTRVILDNLFKEHGLHALSSTTIGPACAIDLVNGDYDTGFYFAQPAAMAGYPHITIPMGTVHGLPVGLSFVGLAWTEAELLALAYAYEQASLKRTVPSFIPALIPA
jgi:amidase